MESFSKINPRLIKNPSSTVVVGEVTHVLRAQGNPSSTSLNVNQTSFGSPIVEGKYMKIPQVQVGIMDYASFVSNLPDFNDTPDPDDSESYVYDPTPWNVVGAASLDALLCPYNNSFGDAGHLPSWKRPEDEASIGNSVNLNPFNPFNALSGLSDTPQPLANDPWMSGGHNIAMSMNGESTQNNQKPVDFYFEKDHWARHTVETSNIRSVGFKAPMVLSGWGYDINDNPVPTGANGELHPEAAWNTKLWKSGPIDFRWDESRGVWAAGGVGGGGVRFGRFVGKWPRLGTFGFDQALKEVSLYKFVDLVGSDGSVTGVDGVYDNREVFALNLFADIGYRFSGGGENTSRWCAISEVQPNKWLLVASECV